MAQLRRVCSAAGSCRLHPKVVFRVMVFVPKGVSDRMRAKCSTRGSEKVIRGNARCAKGLVPRKPGYLVFSKAQVSKLAPLPPSVSITGKYYCISRALFTCRPGICRKARRLQVLKDVASVIINVSFKLLPFLFFFSLQIALCPFEEQTAI